MTWDTSKTVATITGSAASKVSTQVTYEGSDKVLVLDVTADFIAADTITISGLRFNNFTAASGPDNLELDIYNSGASHAVDDKYIEIKSSTDNPFIGGSSDGWDYAESGDFTLS
jgi:hypothetical protein